MSSSTASGHVLLQVLEEGDSNTLIKKKEKRAEEFEDLNFLLKSGKTLCKLVSKIVPGIDIDIEKLEVKPSNDFNFCISLFPRLVT